MKLTLLPVLLFSSALVFAADSLTGKWQMHSNIAGNESDQTCTFAQKDNDLSGTCTSDKGTVEITGKIDGKNVTWNYKSDYNGTPLTVNYQGKLESDTKIVGSVSVPEFSAEGDFTAIQAK